MSDVPPKFLIRSDRPITGVVAGIKLRKGRAETTNARLANAAALAGLAVTNTATGLTIKQRARN
jgi:hypothetical protein